ncbi:DNA-binding transcriptional LysR family regulator [Rhizobium leguminosarum]|uniref:DNA-binding transcriptional LysR family regulator n=1 Tax=Rhizobium leguminosarum TaxID=384 RepID=A0AAE2MNE1_RHILE|nr:MULTISPECIES: LysR substrate-binding domain-containing protein [Rhizobium]MBB4292613.1 DNA-binding transcriptional LysR family regulator [Rhizobium leguminosarum]MBB4298851.1 DNA-binding transcriptional LysR family regulator [Rhizobium leguminosarum]MBB4310176.1 DNA-binding transcriptional LysR family regulator [Rhizobium leguminosarum]MBB4434438.1 DNA-binding transcriptional LysR family regulator [Rhizobium esperanzae]MBB4531334.1 DNA-binding transcriptional LysR family regulator [Rhizobiu
MQFRRRLPSLTALVTLEAVLRRKSFTLAATELGVTQAAVSRQIASLEEELGQPLFVRKHRAIEPTAACISLGATLAKSLADIAESVEAIRSRSQDVVTIGATVAFSSFWLLPRLAEFRRANPGILVRVISQDSPIALDGGEVDVAIRYGLPPFSDGTVIASRGDVISPVCSPDYLRRRGDGPLGSADEFIETDVVDRSWYSWSQWVALTGANIEVKPSLRLSHYTETIAAARAGQGIALGWRMLIGTFLEDGTLVRAEESELAAEDRYNVIVPVKAKRSNARDLAAAWLTASLHG